MIDLGQNYEILYRIFSLFFLLNYPVPVSVLSSSSKLDESAVPYITCFKEFCHEKTPSELA